MRRRSAAEGGAAALPTCPAAKDESALNPSLAAPLPSCRSLWLVRLLHAVPAGLLSIIADLAALVCFNRITLWCAVLPSAPLLCAPAVPLAREAEGALGARPRLGQTGASCTSPPTQQIPACACRFGGGIPWKQYQLILKDGVHISSYAARTFDGVAQSSHLRSDNYFYYNCLTGVCL